MSQHRGSSAVRWALTAGAVAIASSACLAPAFAQVGARRQIQGQLDRAQGGRQEQPDTPGSEEDEDLKKIDKAKTVDELTDLGKTFVIAQKLDAAARVVEKIVQRDPKLLEDDQKQSPKSWNDFWFSHRAKLREKKLSVKDAAGRVKLALWLDAAGLTGPARTMLTAALAINKNETSAKELAEKWNIYAGGPLSFDLTLGLKESLVVATIQDEGQAVTPRAKEHSYLIVPLACNTAGQRLMINKGDIKATGDDGKVCPVVGIVVLDHSDSGSGSSSPDAVLADRGKLPELKMPASNEPLWEQIQVQAGERDKPQELVLMNMIHPFVRPTPGKRDQPAPQPAPTGPNKTTKPATGYLAFVIDIPDSAKTVTCSYKGESPAEFDIEFLQALNKPLDKLLPAERDKLAATVTAQTTNKSPAVASVALHKLNEIRLVGARGQSGGGNQTLKASDANRKIETAMVAAFAHESPLVRRTAFDLLSNDDSEDLRSLLTKSDDAALLNNLVAELRAYFTDVHAAVVASATPADGSAAPPPGPLTEGLGLPRLPLGPGVPALLLGCLGNRNAETGEQVLEICLANPGEQTVDVLRHATDALVAALLARVPQLDDAKLKSAVLRSLLRRDDDKMLPKILAAFKGTDITIDKEDDPLLALALGEQHLAVQLPLLELLAKADFSAPAVSEKLKKLIDKYAADDAQPDPKLQAAILKLAEEQMKGVYEAPIKRGHDGSGGSIRGALGFDALLAAVAAAPSTEPAVARRAAARLIALGQVRALNDRLQRLQGDARDNRVRDLIQSLAKDKTLWERDALPVFLGMQLASTDAKTRQSVLAAMTAIQSGVDLKRRWRINLAFKQGLEAKQLVTLSVDADEKISKPALNLLRDLGAMTSAEAAEFAAAADESSRQACLGTFEQNRAAKPVGAFACMVYLDVRANQAPGGVTPPGAAPRAADRNNVPLEAITLTFQRDAKSGQIRVFAAGVQIGPPVQKQEGQPTASPGSIPIDAAVLLRKALASPEAKNEGLAGQINPTVLRAAHVCELKYEQLGAWSAEITFQDSPEASSADFPLRVVGAKIILEPTTQ